MVMHLLLLDPSDIFFLGDNAKLNYFRLDSSSIEEHKIESGVKILSELVDKSLLG